MKLLYLGLALALAGCSESSTNVGGDGSPGRGDSNSTIPSTTLGVASLVPMGKGGQEPFKLAWWTTLGNDSGHKAVPLAVFLDQDTEPDLLLNPRKLSFRYYPSKGQGTFDVHQDLSGDWCGGWGGDAGDIDSDGDADVAFGDHIRGANVFLNDGAGVFSDSSPGIKNVFSGAGLGDVNGDRKLDLVLGSDQFSTGMLLFFGDGKGGWTEAQPSGLPGYGKAKAGAGGASNIGHLAFADLDHDGDLDLFAFGQQYTGELSCKVFANDGTGKSWTEVADLDGGIKAGVGGPIQGSVADINGDNFVDVAVGGVIHLSNSGTSFSSAASVTSTKLSHLGDMDGDGDLDLVTHGTDGLRLYLGDGTGKVWTPDDTAGLPDGNTFPPGAPVADKHYKAYGIDLADLDGNGNLDIVRVVVASRTEFIVSKHAAYLEVWVR